MVVAIIDPRRFSRRRLEEQLKGQKLEYILVFQSERLYNQLAPSYRTVLLGWNGVLLKENYFPKERLPECGHKWVRQWLENGVRSAFSRAGKHLYREFRISLRFLRGVLADGIGGRTPEEMFQMAAHYMGMVYREIANALSWGWKARQKVEEFLLYQSIVISSIYWNLYRSLVYCYTPIGRYKEMPIAGYGLVHRLTISTLIYYTPTREDLYQLPDRFHYYYLRLLVRRFLELKHQDDLLDDPRYGYRGMVTLGCLRPATKKRR